jgi:hypothetical protein
MQGSVAKTYYNYILSLGFIPADLVGSGDIGPGAVLVYQKGLPVVWATQEEAFPKLRIDRTPSGLGAFGLTSQVGDTNTALEISCDKGTKASTSLTSLQATSEWLYSHLNDDQEYYVVTESIACERLAISDTSTCLSRTLKKPLHVDLQIRV